MQTALTSKPISAAIAASEDLPLRSRARQLLLLAGEPLTRVGLAIVIGSIGGMKFTSYEAEGISAFVRHSPLMGWLYKSFSVAAVSAGLGVVELTIAAGLLIGGLLPRIGVWAGLASAAMFASTLTFLVTTPGAFEPTLGGFPALSAMPGQFLIKDLARFGASVWRAAASLANGVDTTPRGR